MLRGRGGEHLVFDNAALPKPYVVPDRKNAFGLTVEVATSSSPCYKAFYYNYTWDDGPIEPDRPTDDLTLGLPLQTPLPCSESSGYRGTFFLESVDTASGALSGWIEWPRLISKNHITGTWDGQTLRFTEDRAIVAGGAVLGCLYELIKSGSTFAGTYTQCPQGAKPGRFTLPIPAPGR